MSRLLHQVSELPELGVGVVHVPGLDSFLESRPDLVQVIEVEPSSFWLPPLSSTTPYRVDAESLRALAAYPQPKLVHGVGFPLGGSRFPDPRHVSALVQCIESLSAPWASEHLSFNEAGPEQERFNTAFLLPPLQTRLGVNGAAESIRRVADAVHVPFAVETGVNYLAPREGQLRDSDFVRAVCETADCGILLDLHNVWTNERNGREPVLEFVERIPLDRVWEIHVAGGLEHGGYWLDAHSGAVPESLLELAYQIVPRLRNLKSIIFEILPTFLPTLGLHGFVRQMELLNELWKARGAGAVRHSTAPEISLEEITCEEISPREWENTVGSLIIGVSAEGALAEELIHDGGVDLLRGLVQDFRAGTIVDTLQLTARLVMLYRDPTFLKGLLQQFWHQSPPEKFAALEAQNFAAFLRAQSLDIPYLAEVLDYEAAIIRAAITEESCNVSFQHSPDELLLALRSFRRPPDDLPLGAFELKIFAQAITRTGADPPSRTTFPH